MIRPRGTEGSFAELQRRIHALSSVNCEPQIAIRTNLTYQTNPLGLERPPEIQRKQLVNAISKVASSDNQ